MESNQSLPTELSLAIRSSHTQLNRLITARLPLCLPPHASKPNLYVYGMLVFSHLYTAIEGAWDQILHDQTTDARILEILQTLQTPGLRRSERLDADLIMMESNLTSQDMQRLQGVSARTQHYQQTLHTLLVGRPHLLLAWSWNMYLAIFNGGRYIRQALRDGGDGFWQGGPPLTFWEFDGELDGEDIKVAFKKKFDIVCQCLTRNERAEVVDEAKRVMNVCQELVYVLDGYLDTPKAQPVMETARKTPVAPAATMKAESVSMLVVVLALLGGVWQAVLQLLSSWKGIARPALETTKDVHLD